MVVFDPDFDPCLVAPVPGGKGGVMLSAVTPAMAAGVSDHVWTLDELIALLPTMHSC